MPENDPNVIKQLEAPMPWIGTYAAIASTACTLLMAADVFRGVQGRKFWFPSKYFSLNATTLALLAVAMKLPVDITTKMNSVMDRLAKVSSLAFMSIAMANFLTSLGSMDDKSLIMNTVALGIMVITITGNVCIQIIQMRSYLDVRRAFWEESVAMAVMLAMLVMVVSSALTILSTKQYLEMRYQDMHSSALDGEEAVDVRRASTKKLRVLIRKYFVMAETSSPRFVIARSVTCTVSGILSLTVVIMMVEAEIRIMTKEGMFDHTYSTYKQSTRGILLSQSIGTVVGAIAPTSRWFVAINHRTSALCNNMAMGDSFKVEEYWTQKLVEWRQSSLSVEIQHLKSKKLLYGLKGLILDLGISVQHMIVVTSKAVLAICICVIKPIRFCLDCIRLSGQKQLASDFSHGSSSSHEVDMRRYVIQLEGEVELPAETLRNISREMDAIIKKGRKRKPQNLLSLLSKSCSFKGVAEFDSHEVPTLHPQLQGLPYCWSLPIVTLACIARAIPNVGKEKSEQLLLSVAEGLRYAKLIDSVFDKKGRLAKARAAADTVSVEAELNRKWQNKDLHEISVHGRNAKDILKQLYQGSEEIVDEFKRNPKNCHMQNSVYLPPKVIAANAMYRISKTILLNHNDNDNATDVEVFEKLSVMIADILAACLTNLPRAITTKCHRSAIEERGGGVRKAAKYLGETEEIIQLLQKRQLPILAPDQAAQIEEWRASIGLENKDNNPREIILDYVTIITED